MALLMQFNVTSKGMDSYNPDIIWKLIGDHADANEKGIHQSLCFL